MGPFITHCCCATPAGHNARQIYLQGPSSGVLPVLQSEVREHRSADVPNRLCPAASQRGVFKDVNVMTAISLRF